MDDLIELLRILGWKLRWVFLDNIVHNMHETLTRECMFQCTQLIYYTTNRPWMGKIESTTQYNVCMYITYGKTTKHTVHRHNMRAIWKGFASKAIIWKIHTLDVNFLKVLNVLLLKVSLFFNAVTIIPHTQTSTLNYTLPHVEEEIWSLLPQPGMQGCLYLIIR